MPCLQRGTPHYLPAAQKIILDLIEREKGTVVTRDWKSWRLGWSEEEWLPNTVRRKHF
jgi:uncharacterized protein (UPF0216 family)